MSTASRRLGGLFIALVIPVSALGAAGCGGSDDRELSEEEAALMADEKYGETTFEGADVGGIMQIDDDVFRLGVIDSDGEEAKLQVIHSTDESLDKTVTVEFLSVFTVGQYRVQVVTVGERAVAVEWAKEQ